MTRPFALVVLASSLILGICQEIQYGEIDYSIGQTSAPNNPIPSDTNQGSINPNPAETGGEIDYSIGQTSAPNNPAPGGNDQGSSNPNPPETGGEIDYSIGQTSAPNPPETGGEIDYSIGQTSAPNNPAPGDNDQDSSNPNPPETGGEIDYSIGQTSAPNNPAPGDNDQGSSNPNPPETGGEIDYSIGQTGAQNTSSSSVPVQSSSSPPPTIASSSSPGEPQGPGQSSTASPVTPGPPPAPVPAFAVEGVNRKGSAVKTPPGLNIWAVIRYANTALNQGSAYNSQTGVFTAPSNGLYHFELLAVSKAKTWSGFGIADYPSMNILAQTRSTVTNEPKTLSVNLFLNQGQQIVPAFTGHLDCYTKYDPMGISVCKFSGYRAVNTV